MFSLNLISLPLTWFFFLFVSFWPWEKDLEEIKKSSLEIPTDPALLKVVRVALFYEKPEVLISIPSSYELESLPEGESLAEGSGLALIPVRPAPSGIRVGSDLYPVSGVKFLGSAREVEVEKKKYHDAIRVLKNPAGSLTVINEIDIEDYLKGVVPSEVHPDWPEEALKAQAVVSRTYAIFKNIENRNYPFTLSADVGSQVYKGKNIEHSATTRAVEITQGEILTYRGRIFPAFFHSSCGGRTTRADYQWKVDPHPALKGVECNFCAGSKHSRWQAEYGAGETQRLLSKKGFRVDAIQSIALGEVDLSGRPRFFEIKHAGGGAKIPANEFRLALGADRMRSTQVNIEKQGDRFLFRGRGWGHGVGLCQWGAKQLAQLGYKYRDILRYYYPESEIRNVSRLPKPSLWTPSEPGKGNVLRRWFGKMKEYVEDL